MSIELSARLHASRRTPLAACMGAIFALATPAAYATTWPVTNCSDAGTGSLRAAVASSFDNDIVDASALTTGSPGCTSSTITLTTGDIVYNWKNLTIQGPSAIALTVTGKYNLVREPYRIFTHNGTGMLTIKDLTVGKGYVVNATDKAKGGCIYSKGNVSLQNANVSGCIAKSTSDGALGGGIYTKGSVSLDSSTVSHNTADGGISGFSRGGGVYAVGSFVSSYSSVVGNATTNGGSISSAGGVRAGGPITQISNSTISGNISRNNIGGLNVGTSGGNVLIVNSTISGNIARLNSPGGIHTYGNTQIYNSTIAFNTALHGDANSAAGLTMSGPSGTTVTLSSTVIANNSYGAPASASDVSKNNNVTVSAYSSNNLIRTLGNFTLPVDTIVGVCPLLGPLRDNGGRTQTHALLSHSPAIDYGNNLLGLSQDQRGSPYVRRSGPGGFGDADIGAYEVDQTDKVFDTDFEGCS